MTTDKAIKALLEGKRIQLPEWNQLFYVMTQSGIVLTDKDSHMWGGFHLSEKELMRNDWIAIKGKEKIMSNNAPDYENDLVFPPQEIKSQYELSEQGRQSDVLITAIERCEKLEKEIIALKNEYQAECQRADELEDSLQTSWRNESKLKKQLEIAVKALEEYTTFCRHPAEEALTKIKELKK